MVKQRDFFVRVNPAGKEHGDREEDQASQAEVVPGAINLTIDSPVPGDSGVARNFQATGQIDDSNAQLSGTLTWSGGSSGPLQGQNTAPTWTLGPFDSVPPNMPVLLMVMAMDPVNACSGGSSLSFTTGATATAAES